MQNTATDFSLSFLPWLESRGEVSWARTIDQSSPRTVDIPDSLAPDLIKALESRGIGKLYSHQAKAFEYGRKGRDFVVVTPTASGKTLCYNLPVVQTLLEDQSARALYLFPTKALSQDQQAELGEIALGGDLPIKVQTYDGDTPSSLRTVARTSGRIVITNPDMLHSGILPNHAKWITFFSGLKYIVVDEMHAYRGVFGSHVANVIKRLLRIAAFYGASPSFILCSATIGNPRELAEALIGRPVELLEENGAGKGRKTVVFYNPPLVDPARGLRKSSALESQAIALELLRRGVKTILFARSRVQVELIAGYINDTLRNPYNDNEGIVVKPYRSGLLPSERRLIEKGLREGSVHGVVSTNALELGIDIGGIDAAVIAGYPGSISSFWQQAGRAGRRSGESLAVFVATSSPLDQYFSRHPEYFLAQSPERARVDPDNPYIYTDHAKCAAFEIPFSAAEAESSASTREALELLEEEGIVRHTGGRWYWSNEGYPSEKISLRSAAADNVVIVDVSSGSNRVIGEMDRPSAKELIFDNAVYMHMGTQYIVEKLDVENRICRVVKKVLEYWTDAVVKTDIGVLTEDDRGRVKDAFAYAVGDVLVRSQAEKFKKLRFHTHENVGFGEISLPPEEMQTRALVLLFPPDTASGAFLSGLSPAEAAGILVGSARLLHSLAPVFVMCDPRDLGVAERVRDPHFGVPALYLYDKYPGGTGLAEGLSVRLPELFAAALERNSGCGCESGCPSCIGVDLADGESAGRPGSGFKRPIQEFLGLCSGV